MSVLDTGAELEVSEEKMLMDRVRKKQGRGRVKVGVNLEQTC